MEKTSQLLRLQEERYEQIQKSQINYKKPPKERLVLSYLDTRLENLEKDWQIFKTSHDHLVAQVAKEQRSALAYFSDDMYEQFEEIYITYKSELKTKLHLLAQEKPHTTQKQNPIAEIQLPKIKIPTFSGKYIDWPSFLDLFTSIIHNNTTLDDVQKLHYLKSSLAGEAEILLRSISVTSQNYRLAWETLNNRYNNKRYISNCLLKRLFGVKVITIESALSIKQLLDTTVECLSSLNNLGLPTGYWDIIVIYMTVTKLDPESQKLWEQHVSIDCSNDFPTFHKLKLFMETRFRSLEMTENVSRSTKLKSFHASSPTPSGSPVECAYCKEDHYIYQCKQFAKQPYSNKHDFIQNSNMCFNCLNPNHTAAKCMRNTACRICNRKHHSLLHPDKKESVKEESHQDQSDDNNISSSSSHFIYQPGQVLLATALVDVVSRNKKPQIYRALIDQGSQASFVTEDLVQTMGLKREKINGKVSGISEGSLHIKSMVEVHLKSRCNSNFTILVKAYVLKKITNYLPTQPLDTHTWSDLTHIELADPEFDKCNKVNILLGAEVFTQIIDVSLLKSPSGIIAQQTQLGWILSGSASRQSKSETEKQPISMHLNVNVSDMIRKFWEIENETLTFERKLTREEQRCENIYRETTKRTESDRYKVNLPFKEDVISPVDIIGKTKEIAISRFLQLEKRFQKDSKLHKEYTNVIQEYLDLGHMTLTNDNEENVIYLPHHAVIRNDKDTTKVRTVFDASASGSKVTSLNNILLVGPTLQKDLRYLIMEWRQHQIAIIGDIVKMYRQVQVSDEHTNYQRIVWRTNPNEEFKSYKLLTVTFGTASAPFLAVRTLMQVADDEGQKYPLAAEIVKTSFYIDDLLTGASNEIQATEIYTQTTQLLSSAGFELQKWSSNSDRFLENIAQHKREVQPFEIKFDQIIKTLGLSWDRINDKFKFHINQTDVTSPMTKRSVLAEVARLFDPFGWLAPVIITAKVFIQKLWLCSADWDDVLPSDLQDEWLSFREQLPNLHNIELDRWMYTHPDNDQCEIYGFADASTTAYAAVLYMRVVQNNKVYLSILESKTKVAPLKQISVPRLELCAAVLLAKLLSEAAYVLKIPRDKIYAYTDSKVVLAWIQASPIRWQTFVANRITEIQNRIDNDRWSHVASKENPADLASRGVSPSEFQHQQLWWEGPPWLMDLEINRKKRETLSTDLEEKIQAKVTLTCFEEKDNFMERFLNFNKMLRVLTYCRRFLRLKLKREVREEPLKYLTCKEIKETLDVCLKYTQKQKFEEEIQDLKEKGRIKKRSKLISLNPYFDEFGLLRVGGRLQAATLPHEYKHPVIIPGDSHLANLLVKDAHLKLLHGGIALTMNFLRSRYWIIGLKPLVKGYFRKCVVCTKHRALTIQPQMGELPRERVNPGRPFKVTGVDFAGPIQIRTSKGRGQKSFKGYICLFVSMVTRAIHLEVVSDLTTPGFMAAFHRFVSRRGHCSDLWSDNGLNFVGAANELTLMLNESMNGVLMEVAELLSNDGTTWHFIPPRAPNFGGLWEASIKSVKTHLTKTISASTLTFEEMSTLLSQIEACLNSRPIGELNDDPNDLAPLTAHFLIGESLITILDTRDENEWISPLHRWKLIQRMMTNFWKRWAKEFLHTMQQRYKWQTKTTPPQIGDVVVVKEDNLPPAKWLLARITQIHLGPDGEARVAELKGKGSTFKRPLSKIISLPRLDTA